MSAMLSDKHLALSQRLSVAQVLVRDDVDAHDPQQIPVLQVLVDSRVSQLSLMVPAGIDVVLLPSLMVPTGIHMASLPSLMVPAGVDIASLHPFTSAFRNAILRE